MTRTEQLARLQGQMEGFDLATEAAHDIHDISRLRNKLCRMGDALCRKYQRKAEALERRQQKKNK